MASKEVEVISNDWDADYLMHKHPCSVFDHNIKFYDIYNDVDTGKVLEHVYFVSDKKNFSEIYDFSVTTFVHQFFPKFDADTVIKKMMQGKKWRDDPSYKYYRMPAEEIKSLWDEIRDKSASLGTKMHANIEKFYNHPDLWTMKTECELKTRMADVNQSYLTQSEIDTKEMRQFFDYHLNCPGAWNWIPWRTELRVFDRDIRVAGSVDMLYLSPNYTPENKLLVMVDWKRSKEIINVNIYRRMAFPPLEDLDDTNFCHYSLQLNVYKRIIEKNTDFKIEYMTLGVFHPNYEHYMLFPVSVMDSHVDKMWAVRLQQLAV